MSAPSRDIFVQYAELEQAKRDIENSQLKLKEQMVSYLNDGKLERVVVEGAGTFTIVKRKNWKYSKEVTHAREELENLQEAERRDGTATFEEKTGIAFYPGEK